MRGPRDVAAAARQQGARAWWRRGAAGGVVLRSELAVEVAERPSAGLTDDRAAATRWHFRPTYYSSAMAAPGLTSAYQAVAGTRRPSGNHVAVSLGLSASW